MEGHFRHQAEACAELGSPMYAELVARLADDIAAGGVTTRVLAGHEQAEHEFLVTLRLWPGGQRRTIGVTAPHGFPTTWE